MRNTSIRIIALITAFCIAFSCLPLATGSLEANAASPLFRNFKCKSKTSSAVTLKWSRLSGKQRKKIDGIAVYRNGKLIKKISKKRASYKDNGLKAGKTYRYQLKTYKVKKVKQYFNAKTGKWTKKKPAKKYIKKTRRVKTIKCINASKTIKVKVKSETSFNKMLEAEIEQPTEPSLVDEAFSKSELSDMTLDLAEINGVNLDEPKYGPYHIISVATKETVDWSSSNEDIVTITGYYGGSTALLCLRAEGTAKITATNWDGQIKSFIVNVYDSGKNSSYGTDDNGVNEDETPASDTDDSYTSILEGDSTNELCRNEWIALYDDGHVKVLKDNVKVGEYFDEIIFSEESVKGSVHYWKEDLQTYVRGYELLKEKGYYYNLKFLHQPYSNVSALQFIETNDPDGDDFSIGYYNAQGKTLDVGGVNVAVFAQRLPIVNLGSYDAGYTRRVLFFESGELTAKIYLNWLRYELESEGRILAQAGWAVGYPEESIALQEPWYVTSKVNVIDEEKEHDKWLDGIVKANTNDSMTPEEKVISINRYLERIAVYPVSVKNENGKWVLAELAEEYGIPNYLTNRWNSYTTPYELEKIGAKVGYPLRSMYADYEYGTEAWRQYHYYAQSVEDPAAKFTFCPYANTGYTYSYNMVDLDTWDFYEAY